jgi:nitroimidazol reductase NimA-like FMN-containing flavoprotein (pyridoxamine 5'-phosphate oxidase superfamily)
MDKEIENRKTMERLVAGQRLAVLATNGSAGPYLSLVAFAASADRRSFYFATPRNTRKLSNLEEESRVALLIDERPVGSADFSQAAAVTITGTARELSGEELAAALELYSGRHPELAAFAGSPSSAFVKISISGLYPVNGFRQAPAISE